MKKRVASGVVVCGIFMSCALWGMDAGAEEHSRPKRPRLSAPINASAVQRIVAEARSSVVRMQFCNPNDMSPEEYVAQMCEYINASRNSLTALETL